MNSGYKMIKAIHKQRYGIVLVVLQTGHYLVMSEQNENVSISDRFEDIGLALTHFDTMVVSLEGH